MIAVRSLEKKKGNTDIRFALLTLTFELGVWSKSVERMREEERGSYSRFQTMTDLRVEVCAGAGAHQLMRVAF